MAERVGKLWCRATAYVMRGATPEHSIIDAKQIRVRRWTEIVAKCTAGNVDRRRGALK